MTRCMHNARWRSNAQKNKKQYTYTTMRLHVSRKWSPLSMRACCLFITHLSTFRKIKHIVYVKMCVFCQQLCVCVCLRPVMQRESIQQHAHAHYASTRMRGSIVPYTLFWDGHKTAVNVYNREASVLYATIKCT